ncbi:MAG TPA: efflux RND transporter periplasmic adaptor subunit [Bryobacteraceae bacterium]|nr:efflux RND transporter periplasmic adaptor subunit [Bryobacteraceae bacterium]
MKYLTVIAAAAACVALSLALAGCGQNVEANPKLGAPPPADVIHVSDGSTFTVDHPEQFPLATAGEHDAAPELKTTGTVSADISRNIPVISLASGRIVEIDARLGDTVTKGQLLLKVQSQDIAQAFSDYRQAVADETLAKAQLDRSQVLLEKGAIAKKDEEVAEDAAVKAKITTETAEEHLRVLGADMNHPSSIVEIHAPVSGVITDQEVTAAAGVKTLDNSPNLFTISDLSKVWIICDVYENDMSFVHLGEYADIHLAAYPNLVLKGHIANISPTLDPNIRTEKVRLEVDNPKGLLRFGMFVNATFHGPQKQLRATVPASAVLHLHDRDWVYAPDGNKQFRRIEVIGGDMLPGNLQEIVSGIQPGQQVVSNALVLQSTVEQ